MDPTSAATAWDTDRAVLRLPDPAVEIVDDRFSSMVAWNDVIERLWTGGRWLEGPVWFGDTRQVVFSDIPNNRMLSWSEETGEVSVFRSPSDNANGHTRDRQGRLVSCEHLTRRVTRTEHDGRVSVVMDRYQGAPLNAPNDVTVHSDGSIWFTDPGYGIDGHYEGDRAGAELPRHVYRVDPDTGAGTPVITDMERPNGICFSPDESLVYVVDVDTIRVYDVDGATAVDGRVFVDMSPGNSDGLRCDTEGNVWAAAFGGGAGWDGVHCYDPTGTLLGRITLPEACANLCFGGPKKNRLFMTASRSLYSVYVNVLGAQQP